MVLKLNCAAFELSLAIFFIFLLDENQFSHKSEKENQIGWVVPPRQKLPVNTLLAGFSFKPQHDTVLYTIELIYVFCMG